MQFSETTAKPLFDGVLYPSRNNYPAKSIALFERAAAKVALSMDIDLVDHVDWPLRCHVSRRRGA
ncbi:Uncharacterised protein [Pseudomonas aeruginosa]|nr:Uncharacterised protein [Pseudomonas aeruginosa]